MYGLGRKKSSVCCILPKTILRAAGIEAGSYVKIRSVGRVIVIEGIAEVEEDPFEEVGAPKSGSPDSRQEPAPSQEATPTR